MPLSNKNLCFPFIFLLVLILFIASCAKREVRIPINRERGVASWYGPGFHGRRTASGERFDQRKMTAAHRNLPFGTWVKVINLENDKSVVVRINDRGPFRAGRIIDLSRAAAKKVGLLPSGTAKVLIFYLPEEEKVSKPAEGSASMAGPEGV